VFAVSAIHVHGFTGVWDWIAPFHERLSPFVVQVRLATSGAITGSSGFITFMIAAELVGTFLMITAVVGYAERRAQRGVST
jgi:hypothetical protein